MTMQRTPLLLSRILGRGAALDPNEEVVTLLADGTHRQTLKATWDRANQLAHALAGAGVKPGDRVASFMWNNYRHLELYQAVPSMGAVLHTLNIRLSPTDLEYIINHAADKVIVADEDLCHCLSRSWTKCPRLSGSSSAVTVKGARPALRALTTMRTSFLARPPSTTGQRSTKTPHGPLLHQRHHGQAKRRDVHQSVYLPAHDEPGYD